MSRFRKLPESARENTPLSVLVVDPPETTGLRSGAMEIVYQCDSCPALLKRQQDQEIPPKPTRLLCIECSENEQRTRPAVGALPGKIFVLPRA